MRYYDYVNTKMGSLNSRRYSNGNCYPVTAVPRGMNFFTLQTNGKEGGWFYSPADKYLEGVKLTHMPSPWLRDYGSVLMWGDKGESVADSFWTGYDPERAILEPAYMSVLYHRNSCKIELSPTDSAAVIRLSFGERGPVSRLRFKCDFSDYKFCDDNNILYITIPVKSGDSKIAINEYLVVKADLAVKCSAEKNCISLEFKEESATFRFATSFISVKQAELNLAREVGERTLEEVRAEGEAIWEKALSQVKAEDSDIEKLKTLYSCLYRYNLWPRKLYERDENGTPYHPNTATGEITKGVLYTDNGFWDTFRTVYPLMSLLDRELYGEIAEGFYNYYVDTGWLPKWVCPYNLNCMPGMLIEATMADAIVKDIVKGELAEEIFEAMLKDGEYDSGVVGFGRVNLSQYRKYGYLPYTTTKESVNETLDNSYGDFCIAMAARKLGKTDIEKKYLAYSKNYKLLFDKDTGFMRGKDENGNFRDECFDPYAWGRDYTEGSAWQNSFGVYHDIKGLDELFSGKLEEKIDELMVAPTVYRVGSYGETIHEMSEMVAGNYGQCAISNQPSFHIPYIYSELGLPEKTAQHMKELAKLYNSTERGYPGDEDNGSASAWYILSAMGLYQMAPSRADFATSVSLFDKLEVSLSGGNKLIIIKEDYELDKMSGRVAYDVVMKGGNLAEIVKNK